MINYRYSGPFYQHFCTKTRNVFFLICYVRMQWISRNNHCVARAILALSSAYQEYLMTWKLKTSLVVQRARPLRTYSLIILDILDTKKSNLIIVLLHIERKKWKSCFCFFIDGKQHKVRELDMTTRDLECS